MWSGTRNHAPTVCNSADRGHGNDSLSNLACEPRATRENPVNTVVIFTSSHRMASRKDIERSNASYARSPPGVEHVV